MLKTKFSINWNKKLNCNFFTTIRLRNDNVFFTSAKHAIFMKAESDVKDPRFPEEKQYYFLTMCEIVCVEMCKLIDIPETIFLTDTGYDKKKSIEMIQKMYKNNENFNNDSDFVVITFKKLHETQEEANKNPTNTY
jgi:hypothetical protein